MEKSKEKEMLKKKKKKKKKKTLVISNPTNSHKLPHFRQIPANIDNYRQIGLFDDLAWIIFGLGIYFLAQCFRRKTELLSLFFVVLISFFFFFCCWLLVFFCFFFVCRVDTESEILLCQ